MPSSKKHQIELAARDATISDLENQLQRMRRFTTGLLYTLVVAIISLLVVSNTTSRLLNSICMWGLGECYDNWQFAWDFACRLCGNDERIMFIYGTLLMHMGVFWLANAVLAVFDLSGKPECLRIYKVQHGTNEFWKTGSSQFWKGVRVVLFNQLVVHILCAYAAYPMQKRFGMTAFAPLPNFWRFIVEMAFFLLMHEVTFYYSHRALHHKSVYKYVHKIHHEWTAPIGLVALYAHPFEHALSNLFPVFIGPLLLGSHLAVTWVWFTMGILNTIAVHSGYHFPWMSSPRSHDYHHSHFNELFGSLGILDELHETNMAWKMSEQRKWHYTYLTLRPPWAKLKEE